ncbi:protein bark beetle-like, partial [Pollicipes pollicipes]|uniref:protein bark beetle-like n=1 Tax=Pollicipes pollicipes TaxID=41117 RepID=UPI001885370B
MAGHAWRLPALVLVAAVSLAGAETEVGGIYSQRTRWELSRSPYVASSDVLVEASGALEIEAGVVVRFRPGIGLTVRGGRLLARGKDREPVVMTTTVDEVDALPGASLRLVDGPSPWEGRVQVFHKDHWRSVCTNSR